MLRLFLFVLLFQSVSVEASSGERRGPCERRVVWVLKELSYPACEALVSTLLSRVEKASYTDSLDTESWLNTAFSSALDTWGGSFLLGGASYFGFLHVMKCLFFRENL